jgi:arsenite methyltransferase
VAGAFTRAPELLVVAALACLLALLAAQLRKPRGWFGRRVMAPFLNEGNKTLLDAALGALAVVSGERVLDVGFGGGYTLERLAHVVGSGNVAGVELSEAMIDAVRARCGDVFDLRLADAAALPFPDACFDAVLSVNTIYFWGDPARVLAEVARVVGPGGRLVIGYRSWLFLAVSPIAWFGFRLRSDRRVAELVRQAGFTAQIRRGRTGERLGGGTKG